MSKKEDIILTSMRLFVQRGFENTPTSQISREASVATGTLFHHFPTKELLITEIYKYIRLSMGNALFTDVDSTVSVKEQMRKVWMNYLRWGFDNRLFIGFLQRFYGSTYVGGLADDELYFNLKPALDMFTQGDNEGILKKLSYDLRENLTMSMTQSFLQELYRLNKFDLDIVAQGFDVYWSAVSL